MAMPDDENPRPSLPRSSRHQDRLNQLGRSWFDQAREKSEQEKAEIEAWNREHNKWAAFNRRFSGVEPDFD